MRKLLFGMALSMVCAGAAAEKPAAEPTGPVAVIDTSMGRVTCRLYSKEAPRTVERFIGLAEGTLDWADGATGAIVHGRPFYDGLRINGMPVGITAGDRVGKGKGFAGPAVKPEKSGLGYERAGRLVMAGAPAPAKEGSTKTPPPLESSSMFLVLDHADDEMARPGSVVFGQCDEASLTTVETISHKLMLVENHPATPVAINHISIVREGQPLPPPVKEVPVADVVPPVTPAPVSSVPSPEPTGPTALIETTMGTLRCRLFRETPVATGTFIALAHGTKDWKWPGTEKVMHGQRFYDGLWLNRVIPDFMIQNQDLPGHPKDDDGSIGFHFDNEIVPGLTFDRPGRLALANAGPDTNTSEFFITEHAVHRLDEHYTIFGQCDEAAVKLVEAIARVPRNKDNRPLTPVVIKTVRFEQ